ncbi:MAG TPA: FtsX-like permease family protein [Dehalococcoidia bacterium]|nr:FtsX-like permease family protein [Dehalococcoidia bacterium]
MAFDVPKGSEVLPGIGAPGPGEIVIDSVFSRKTGLDAGDTLSVRGRNFTVTRVADISNIGLSQFSFISASDARDVIGIPDSTNYALVSVQDGRDPRDVATAIEAAVPGVSAETKAAFAEENRNEIMTFFLPIITVLLVIAFLVGTVVIGLTIYTATIERAREFGVMKAVGAGPGFLYRLVFSQSVILSVAGFVIGLPAALLVNRIAREIVPEFVNVLRWQDILAVFVVTMVMGLAAAVAPVRRINRIDPAIVFKA